MPKDFFGAVATLVGCIIGAGILGIPYVVSRSGFSVGFFYIIFIGIVMLLMHLLLGEVVLRTKQRHQLTGYSEKYLGKRGKMIMLVSMIVAGYGALTAYTIKVGDFLNAIFSGYFGGSAFFYSIVFLAAMAIIIYFNVNVIAKSETVIVGLLIGVIMLIFAYGLPFISLENLAGYDLGYFFAPYGVILFAFLGIFAIPELKQILKKDLKRFKKAVVVGGIVPIAVYLMFSFIVVGVSGKETTDGAIIGLGNAIGNDMLIFGIVFGIMAMMSSFIIIAFSIKKMYENDLRVKAPLSWAVTCSVPLIVMLMGAKSFIRTIGITGSLTGGIICILVILMYENAQKIGDRKPEYMIKKRKIVCWSLIVLFVLGIIQELLAIAGVI